MLRNVKRVSVNVLLWLLSDWCVFFFITLGFTATLGWQGPARATPTVSEGPLRPKPPPARAWWLKALSARVVRAAPNDVATNSLRADVLIGHCAPCGRRGLARQRSSRRRLCTSIGLRPCAVLRRRRPDSSVTQAGAQMGRGHVGCESALFSRFTPPSVLQCLVPNQTDQEAVLWPRELLPRLRVAQARAGRELGFLATCSPLLRWGHRRPRRRHSRRRFRRRRRRRTKSSWWRRRRRKRRRRRWRRWRRLRR